MKKIMAIVSIGLLGFLGCSDNDDTTRTVDHAIPVAPFGIIDTPTPTYEWTPVPWATKYRLLVQDTNQASTIQDTQETSIIDEWYTAEEAGCASEDGLCKVTPDIEVFEENEFKVQACSNDECGMWSETLQYEVAPPTSAGAPRFTDNSDDTVTDNNTKLMWSKNANLSDIMYWQEAGSYCEGLTLAGHSDWRLPSLSEFKSIIDNNEYDPALPPGNPFTTVQSNYYWSSTTHVSLPNRAWVVGMDGGGVSYYIKPYYYYVWPVRSGS